MPCEKVHCRNARSMSCWQKVRVVSVFFTQPFQYFQIVNLVDSLSSWYKFIIINPSNIKFVNFILDHLYRLFLLRIRNVSHKSCTEYPNAHFMFNNFFSEKCAVYEIMWKYIVQPGRPQMTQHGSCALRAG